MHLKRKLIYLLLAPKYLGNNKIECAPRFSKEDYVIVEKAIDLLSGESKRGISFKKAIKILAERLCENKLKAARKKAPSFC